MVDVVDDLFLGRPRRKETEEAERRFVCLFSNFEGKKFQGEVTQENFE